MLLLLACACIPITPSQALNLELCAWQELSVILLDTGTFMQGSLEYACKAVSVYVRSKVRRDVLFPTCSVG